MAGNYIGVLGVISILCIAVALSTNRRAINFRVVGAALAMQALIAAIMVHSDVGAAVVEKMSVGVKHMMSYSQVGIEFVFGRISTDDSFWSFAFNVLPIIVFFSALMSVLYHLRILQIFVKLLGGGLRWVIGTKAVESVNAVANIFFGQTDAPLIIRPYLHKLTEPQLFAVIVSGMASIAGVSLVAYSQLGAELRYLLAAAFMAAPGGLLMAKLIMPDGETDGGLGAKESLELPDGEHESIFHAVAVGTSDGLKMAVQIGAMLIAFIALIALLNGLIGGLAGMLGMEGLTLQQMLGWLFSPLMYLLGVPWTEAQAAGALFGEKIILNEFVAFTHFSEYLAGMSTKTKTIVTFSLCGFANLSSIGIVLGALGSLMPEKKGLIAKMGLRAVAAGSLSNLMSAALVGLLIGS